MKTTISGFLANSSQLREIFPTGIIPLTRPGTVRGKCGDDDAPIEEVYFLAVRSCSDEQREAMAAIMAKNRDCTIEEARSFLSTAEELPIRKFHITGVGMPLRSFL